MKDLDLEKAYAVISILESMEDEATFLSTACLSIDAFHNKLGLSVNKILTAINDSVMAVNNELSPITEKLGGTVKLTGKGIEDDD